ncbi:MAG: hypothetical protein DI586_09075 [Micavibrio aeruginosavorus]|uniref:DUF6898 domain-containing protein n=1 Tax=Micavibrio aeruginosavorus TaxID=349221 RepID=A0A2W5HLN3_9BACT|nr:MAG: hypothetical protein DI586_09075 [Micavibrio aeruginosavorus]
MTNIKGREVFLEFIPMGSIVKVTAMDTQSMTEISIQGPKSAPEEALKHNALLRLEYVLKKKGILPS